MSYTYIDSDQQLCDALPLFEKAKDIAVDTEADSLHSYYEKVCLIQISVKDKHLIIDPLSPVKLTKLFKVLSTKTLLLHGADFDLRMLNASFGYKHKGLIFDTMIASQLLGYEQFNLAYLAEHFCGVPLSKQSRKTDWSNRPLTQNQLDYASNDTRFLEEIATRIKAELKEKDRTSWHQESCARLLEQVYLPKDKEEKESWRIKGVGGMEAHQLLFVQAIWKWRDEEAKKVDTPAFKILNNQYVLDLANDLVKCSKQEPQYPRFIKGLRLKNLKSAIKEAKAKPSSEWPQPPKRTRRPEHAKNEPLIRALKNHVDSVAQELEIKPQVLAPRATIENIAQHRAENVKDMMSCSSILNWQAKLLEAGFRDIFGVAS